MLLTTLSFVVGGNMEKLCQPMLDLTIFSDVSFLGDVIKKNIDTHKTVNVSSFNSCFSGNSKGLHDSDSHFVSL